MLFRYPGAKNKLAKPIVGWLRRHLDAESEYREPFFGGGAVGLALLQSKVAMAGAWFNDNDATLCCVWRAVADYTDDLCAFLHYYKKSHLDIFQHDRVRGVHLEPRFKGRPGVDTPELIAYLDLSPKERKGLEAPPGYTEYLHAYLKGFYDQRELIERTKTMPTDKSGVVAVAWQKIALHQTSYSGLGVGAGPIGGKEQRSDWIMGCRYMPDTTVKKVRQVKKWFDATRLRPEVCTQRDFAELLREPGKAVFYLDPPYYDEGPKLYRDSFGESDHRRLAEMLLAEDRPWLLSYDNQDAIRDLYSKPGIHVKAFDLRYTIVRYKDADRQAEEAERKKELIVSNRPFEEGEFGG